MARSGGRARPGVSRRAWFALLLLFAAASACSGGDPPRASADVRYLTCGPVWASSAASPARGGPSPIPTTPRQPFSVPSSKGVNYGTPLAADGSFLGTRWLRAGGWESARPSLAADLDLVSANDLGRVLRVFVGLDQLMVWTPDQRFAGLDPTAVANLEEALTMFDQHGVRIIAVLFDQEERSSPGNFRTEALDGQHPAMRDDYLRAVDRFMARFGPSPVVAGWDLFNEPYGSLGQGGLPTPPAPDPTSPNYPDAVVHAWIHDLYMHAKCAAPNAWLTVSDTTQLYWGRGADLSRYDDSVDFYDVHVYDDHPVDVAWRDTLRKPLIMGEVGASLQDHHLNDQRLNAKVVSFWLCTGRAEGAKAVLAHNAGSVVFPSAPGHGGLTPTGTVLAAAQS